jgi:hypothetical protein
MILVSFENHPENDDQDTDQEHKNRNAVDRIHVTDPTAVRFVRIPLPDIKIFGQFTQYAHLADKDN